MGLYCCYVGFDIHKDFFMSGNGGRIEWHCLKRKHSVRCSVSHCFGFFGRPFFLIFSRRVDLGSVINGKDFLHRLIALGLTLSGRLPTVFSAIRAGSIYAVKTS